MKDRRNESVDARGAACFVVVLVVIASCGAAWVFVYLTR